MKRYLFSLPFALALLLAGLGSSCRGRLQPGGAYAPTTNGVPVTQPDYAFYVTDAAYDLAYSTIDGAFKFEQDNRITLWKITPKIKHALDDIRPKASQVNQQYLAARTAYMLHPVPANLSALQSLLAKMQQLSVTATAALPKAK